MDLIQTQYLGLTQKKGSDPELHGIYACKAKLVTMQIESDETFGKLEMKSN